MAQPVESQKIMRGGAEEDWKHGLFGCCDKGVGTCCKGFCCGPCAVADARQTMDGSNFMFNCCCVGAVPSYNIIREGYNIKGSACGDICTALLCGPCAATRLLNETMDRGKVGEDGSNGSGGPFKNSLTGCTKSIGTCCLAMICPNVVAAQARTAYDGSECWFNCCCMPLALTRNVIRQGYAIEGSCFNDCILSALCGCCISAQLSYEVAERGPIKKVGVAYSTNQVVPAGAFVVAVPQGAMAGTTLQVMNPATNQPVLVVVPVGVAPGQAFMVQ